MKLSGTENAQHVKAMGLIPRTMKKETKSV